MAASNKDVKNEIVFHNPDGASFDRPQCIEVSIRLDQFYLKIIKDLKFDELPDTERFVEIIKFYIFSGALFEAWINAFLRRYLESKVKILGKDIFDLVERSPIKEKYEFIVKRFSPEWWITVKVTVNKVVSIRNRLMHFKDSPDQIPDSAVFEIPPITNGSVSDSDFIDCILSGVPNPQLYNEIMDDDIVAIRDAVIRAYDELCQLKVDGGKDIHEE